MKMTIALIVSIVLWFGYFQLIDTIFMKVQGLNYWSFLSVF